MSKPLKHIILESKFPEIENNICTIANKIHAKVDAQEEAVYRAIVDEAIKNGITDLFLLDKKFVLNTLKKQVPMKTLQFDSVPHNRCPNCFRAVRVYTTDTMYKYCPDCGQALKEIETESKEVR